MQLKKDAITQVARRRRRSESNNEQKLQNKDKLDKSLEDENKNIII